MSTTVKNVSGNYVINCNMVSGNALGTFTVNAANIVLTGSVTNTQPSVTVAPFLTIGANNTGAITELGVLTQTSLTTFAGLRFDSAMNVWQISSSVDSLGNPISAYANISTGTQSVAGNVRQIQFNGNGSFAASANLTFDSANTPPRLNLAGIEQLVNIGANAAANLTAVSNTTMVYSNPPASGGTGLYTVAPGVGQQELVSKAKAIVYSIIF